MTNVCPKTYMGKKYHGPYFKCEGNRAMALNAWDYNNADGTVATMFVVQNDQWAPLLMGEYTKKKK